MKLMNKKFVIVSIIIIIFAAILGSLTGVPVSSQIEESGCSANYKKYLFPRTICQLVTFGHCATTDLNRHNAEMEVAHCLCDKYLDEPSTELKSKILQKCSLFKQDPNCSSRIERIKTDYCNEVGFNSLECSEYFNKNGVQDVNFICQNKEQIFYKIFIY